MIPKVYRARQRIEHPVIADAGAAVAALLEQHDFGAVRPGQTVAIGAGSRGIQRIGAIHRALVAHVRRLGASPFLFPAMGCHGGGTGPGQRATLEHLGITEATVGCPIHSDIEPLALGATPEGVPVYWDRHAAAADWIVVVNRIKPHSDFYGGFGSGLTKMLAIGIGKLAGADTTHAWAIEVGLEHALRGVAATVLEQAPILGGLGVIEGPTGAIAGLHWLPAADFLTREPELFREACRLAPRIPVPRAGVLAVDFTGKNISGCGMDPFVIGRHEYLGVARSYCDFRADRVYAANLTPESTGNADGIGMADACSRRLVEGLDYEAIRLGVLTSRTLPLGRIPIFFETDREAVDALLGTCAVPRDRASLIHIRDTTHLQVLELTENLTEAWSASGAGEIVSGPRDLRFGADGQLVPLEASA